MTDRKTALAVIEQQLDDRRDTLATYLGDVGLTPERFVRVVVQAVASTPALLQCTQESIVSSVMEAAQLGLEPTGLLGGAYLVPYNVNVGTKDNPKWEKRASMIPGYRGLIDLARRGGDIQTIEARVVYERDVFDLQFGTELAIYHKPTMDADRGQPLGAYMVATLKDSLRPAVEWMTREEIEQVRRSSKMGDHGAWVEFWPEMARKSVVRRGVKYLPMSGALKRALSIEDEVERVAVVTPAVPPPSPSALVSRLAHGSPPDGSGGPSTPEPVSDALGGEEGAGKAAPVASGASEQEGMDL